MTTTLTTAVAAINKRFSPVLTRTIYTSRELMGMINFPPNEGGDDLNWKYKYSSGDAEQANEGDPVPASSYISYADMTMDPLKVQHVVGWTGEVKDLMRSGGNYFDAISDALFEGTEKLLYKAETLAQAQLLAAIDDSATYGGQTRTTVHADSVVVAAGTAALTRAHLSSAYEQLKLANRRANMGAINDWAILSSVYQETAYGELSGQIYQADDETTGANYPYTTQDTNKTFDVGMHKHVFQYNKIPWQGWANMTDGYVLFTRKSDIIGRTFRPVTIEPLGKTDDSDQLLMTFRWGLYHRDPYRAARIEGLTA